MWNDLTKVALVGTDKTALTPRGDGTALDAMIAQLQSQDRETVLLAAAGALRLQEQARYTATDNTDALPPPAEDETLPTCSDEAVHLLAVLLIEREFGLMEEWVQLCSEAGQRVPAQHIPAVLMQMKDKPYTYADVVAIAGARGRWLARYMPAAQPIFQELTHEDWNNDALTPAERGAAFRLWRASNATQAREALEEQLKKEKVDGRVAYVNALDMGLSMSDEPLLESLLDDKSKRVARAAADLLAKLDESGFVARMIERAGGTLKLDKKMKKEPITVHRFTSLDDAMKRDTVDRPDNMYYNDEARWLHMILSAVPPHYWNEWLGEPTDELITLINVNNNIYLRTVFEAWKHAALNHHNPEWITEMLKWHIRTGQTHGYRFQLVHDMARALPPSSLEQLIVDAIRTPNVRRNVSMAPLLCHHQWGEDFTREMLAFAVELADDHHVYQVGALLEHISRHGYPPTQPEAQATFAPVTAKHRPSSAALTPLDSALQVYKRRYDMWRAFGKL